jgi:phosphatidylglycerophosphate synthase
MSARPAPHVLSLPFHELRKIAQPAEYSPARSDKIYRKYSIFLSVPLAKLGLTPNEITLGWVVAGLIGVAGLLSRSQLVRVLAALTLEFSYLLDFVDGEVARLTSRTSKVGGLLDLLGHALIKTALPLAVAGGVFVCTGSLYVLAAGAIGAVAISTSDSLRFHAAWTSGRPDFGDLERVARPTKESSRVLVGNLLLGLFEQSFESPGLFGCTLVAAILNQLEALSVYWMIFGPVRMCLRTIDYSRRLRRIEI